MFEPLPFEGEEIIGLPARIRRVAAQTPDAVTLVDDTSERTATELADLMDRIASFLAQNGVRPGDVVATLGGLTAEHLMLFTGILAAGAAFAPIPTSAHPDSVAQMLVNSGATVLVADTANQSLAMGLDSAQVLDMATVLSSAADCTPIAPVPVSPTDLFDINYSSGTTGAPKGIEHEVRFREPQIVRMVGMGYGPDAAYLFSTPLYSNTTLGGLIPALGLGGKIILMSKFDELRFLELSQHHGVTHAALVPIQYKRLMANPRFDEFDLTSFKIKLSTSAPLPPSLIQQVLDRWPGKLINLYGMTEGGVSAICDYAANPGKWHTVGKPAGGSDVRIIDPDGNILSDGEVGEIVGRSVSIMRGYRNAPEKTREAAWIGPQGETFMRTGDLGRYDEDGFLVLLDRQKDMIISGGFNVFAVDLEDVLLRHPDVAEAAVIGVPSEQWGETPLGLVVLHPAAGATGEAIKDWANAQLGKNQRLSKVDIRTDLPRNAIGKVLKRDLRNPFWGESAK